MNKSTAGNFIDTIYLLEKELKKNLPGRDIQYQMAPSDRDSRYANTHNQGPPVKAAILILLFPEKSKISTVFIKRTRYPGAHSGQISFPGGKYEPEDLQLSKTALRETSEELGIDTKKIAILGELTPLYIGVSNFTVYPFVGYADTELIFRIQKEEVENTITESLHNLSNPKIKGKFRLQQPDVELTAPCFQIGKSKIWGATAMILNEFLALCRNIELV
jgi:8-oxo-dGTP pyrophosphatase MutT (NUDIX family)